MPTTKKVTVSVPGDLLTVLDTLATEKGYTRSGVVTALIREWIQVAEAELMQEGYLAMAQEIQAIAEDAIRLAPEGLPDWK